MPDRPADPDALEGVRAGVWVVETQTATYVVDLDAGELERRPAGEPPADYVVAELRRDRARMPLLEVVRCRVGEPMVVVIDVRGVGVETIRRTTPVGRIAEYSVNSAGRAEEACATCGGVADCPHPAERPIPMTDNSTTNFTVPDEAWEAIYADGGDDADPNSQLLATISINGVLMHLEAIEVADRGWVQTATGSATDLDLLSQAVGGDGPFTTWERDGRRYVLVATPYCS